MKNIHSQLIERFIREMEYRNYSPRSIQSYSSLLSKVESYYNQPLDKITGGQFKEYLHGRITADKISVTMVNQYISAFKILQVDILQRDWERIRIKRPRKEQRIPVVLSGEEVERLIKATANIKHRAILMLAYSSGLRRQELQFMKPSAIDSSRMQIHVVQGKGKKDRYTILAKKTLDILREYYKWERPTKYLFEAQGRKGQNLSESTLNNIIKQGVKKAGINKNISFHTLRHSFATHLLEKGVNLRLIQQFMGHTSLRTTSLYLHIANVNPGTITSPLDSMDL
jgi:integrase/recombinase XerD